MGRSQFLQAMGLIVLMASMASAVEVKPPLKVTLPLCNRDVLRGEISGYDQTAVEFQAPGSAMRQVPWISITPPAQFTIAGKLFGPHASGALWVWTGGNLLKTPDGTTFADRAFAKAMQIDPSLKNEVARIKNEVAANARRSAAVDKGKGGSPATTEPTTSPSSDDQGALTAGLQARATKLLSGTRVPFKEFQSTFFLLYTDVNPSEAQRWNMLLDRMYARLAEIFGVPKGENLWRGKAVIFVFHNHDEFAEFEMKRMNDDKKTTDNADGLCHNFPNGDIMITFFRDPKDLRFAHVLVHETTHGFLFRYCHNQQVISWANEGLAEATAFDMVPDSSAIDSSYEYAKGLLKQPYVLKDYFHTQRIAPPQYSIARTMTEFMIRNQPRRYVSFINGIRDGAGWETSLEKNFGWSTAQLLSAYAEFMGVPGLKLYEPEAAKKNAK